MDEPTGLDDEWTKLGARLQGGACLDTDTYLAAFALAGGHTLTTFDKGFARSDGLQTEIL